MASLTAAGIGRIQHAIKLMVEGQAYETPLDASIIEELSKAFAAADVFGGGETDGDYREALKLRPFSTLLQVILAL